MRIVQLSVGPKKVPLTGYIHDYNEDNMLKNIRSAMIVCPGGGYEKVSDREKDPVALYYFAQGFNTFILDYSIKENAADLNPLLELSDAFVQIRNKSSVFCVNPTEIAVIGFSAGAHLAASLATLYNHPTVIEKTNVSDGYNSPDATILAYPVISMKEYAHQGSKNWVTKNNNELINLLSLENHVNNNMSPIFIWHTEDDETVDVQNSMLYVNALIKNKVPCEFHLFPNGEHGLSMCTTDCYKVDEHVGQWKQLSLNWLHKYLSF
ncbi:MAG: alpha/beta hydrolase [Spirochaetia bacterium]|nr:alpha/beta hydrolase [Spirochaetia bacterium]